MRTLGRGGTRSKSSSSMPMMVNFSPSQFLSRSYFRRSVRK
ncbi:MAG: hypothetical protein NZ733_01970 [Aigarchaeota archaeon]|nr:hypothetical protein [Aigarchaeota archaeon]MDW8043441.1 hypothetical protein [Nitrososphaerota archaeon]